MARGDVFPKRNLSLDAENWGRQLEARIKSLEKDLAITEQMLGSMNRSAASRGGGGGVAPPPFARDQQTVHIILGAGQSNMEGRGEPYSAITDPTNPRIWQYPQTSPGLIPAAEPLDDPRLIKLGIGPAFQFSRRLLQTLPEDDQIVIVPAAVGNTALVEATTDAWMWGGAPNNLSAKAVTQTLGAIALAQETWPDAVVKVSAILWVQGERDGRALNITKPVYLAELQALIAGFRTSFGDNRIPFIIGQMTPEGMSVGTGYQINSAHSTAPLTTPMTGFALGPAGMVLGDDLHYTGQGQRHLARSMFREYERVISGLAPMIPEQPWNATRSTLVVDWITQTGIVIVPSPTTTRKSVSVTFNQPFGGVPSTVAEGNVGGDNNVTYTYTAGATATGFNVYYRAGSSIGDRTVTWIASGPEYLG